MLPILLFCGAFAVLRAIARVGRLLRCRLERRPAGVAELGVPFSEANRYLICIGDECTAKSEHVWRARVAAPRATGLDASAEAASGYSGFPFSSEELPS